MRPFFAYPRPLFANDAWSSSLRWILCCDSGKELTHFKIHRHTCEHFLSRGRILRDNHAGWRRLSWSDGLWWCGAGIWSSGIWRSVRSWCRWTHGDGCHAHISKFEPGILQNAARASQRLTDETRHHICRWIGCNGDEQTGFRGCHLTRIGGRTLRKHLVSRRAGQLHLRCGSQIQSAAPDIPFGCAFALVVTSGIATL